jgi:hypothetical protein
MKRTPCEYIIWKGLPAIRKEIAESMIRDFGLSQREAANKLGITPSAVCQYLSNKRGHIAIDDESLLKEINYAAKTIIENEDVVVSETCRICKILKSKEIFFKLEICSEE